MTTRNPFSRRARLPLAVSLASSLAAPAFGVTFNIGEIEGSFDSALSVGASWSTAKPNKNLIGVNNGGKGTFPDLRRQPLELQAWGNVLEGLQGHP